MPIDTFIPSVWNEIHSDIHSMYGVSHNLLYHQRQKMSADVLLSTIDHGFPKPLECGSKVDLTQIRWLPLIILVIRRGLMGV